MDDIYYTIAKYNKNEVLMNGKTRKHLLYFSNTYSV